MYNFLELQVSVQDSTEVFLLLKENPNIFITGTKGKTPSLKKREKKVSPAWLPCVILGE